MHSDATCLALFSRFRRVYTATVLYILGGLLLVLPLLYACSGQTKPQSHYTSTRDIAAPASDFTREHFFSSSRIPKPLPRKHRVSEAKDYPRFTVSLSDVSVREVLKGLSHDAELDLVMESGVIGEVTLHLHNRPLPQILNHIERQLPLRFEFNEREIRVYEDVPYVASYVVDYLNIAREASSDVDLSTQIGAISLSAGGNTPSGGGNNSSTIIKNTSVNNFWDSLSDNLNALLLLVDGSGEGQVIADKISGHILVRATHKTQQLVKDYLQSVLESVQRQVLIEALIVEVSLSDRYAAGVDWRVLSRNGNYAQSFSGGPVVSASTVADLAAPSAVYSLINNSSHGGVTATLNLLREFGQVRILSSPKINALNNQAAVLKVVDNRVYFTLDVKKETHSDSEETLTTSSTAQTVPVGLVMNVIPYISEKSEVTLNIRPTISRILGFVADPNPDLAGVGVQNLVPEIQVREMESVLRVRSGGLVVIGGLMQERKDKETVEVPLVSSIPFLGEFFRFNRQIDEKTELLVLLRPTVIAARGVPAQEFLQDYVLGNG